MRGRYVKSTIIVETIKRDWRRVVSGRAKRIIYRYDGRDEDSESEIDVNGEVSCYAIGTIITRHGKQWKIVHAELHRPLDRDGLPILNLSLTQISSRPGEM
jgi:hypothetical protein